MTDKNVNLGGKIKTAIRQSNKKPLEIAKEMGISEANIYKLYKSENPKVLTLIKLAEVTGLSLSYFISIDDSAQIKELTRKLEEEKKDNELLEMVIRNQHYFILQFLDLIANMEDITNSKETLTLLLPDNTKKIPLSRLLRLTYKLFTMLNENISNEVKNEEEMLKLVNVLMNIIEFRQLILHPPDESFMLPKEITDFLRDNALYFKKEDEYIDFLQLVK